MYDCAIIGTGPAGLSSALTLKARGKSFIWFGTKDLSLKVNKAEKIKNYPGLINVSGEEMTNVFKKQIEAEGLEITDKIVTGVYNMGSSFNILCNQDMYEAKTVILATGVSAQAPIPGEEELLGMGVSYCATCDGFLYKGKEVAVVVQDESYLEEVEYLANTSSTIHVIPLYKDCSFKADNATIKNEKPKALSKENKKIIVEFKDSKLIVDGIFFLKSAISASILVPGLETDGTHVIVDRECKTNMNGLFAAGDITGKPYQYTKAVGEGNIAAHSAVYYLATNK